MDFLEGYMVAVIVGICYCIGFMIKHIVPGEKVDRLIPLIMGSLGVFLNIWANNWNVNPDIILGGLASGLASTGVNQVFKQIAKFRGDE